MCHGRRGLVFAACCLLQLEGTAGGAVSAASDLWFPDVRQEPSPAGIRCIIASKGEGCHDTGGPA